MRVEEKLQSLLSDARKALGSLDTDDQTVQGLVNRVSELRYAEGTLTGFLDALVLTDAKTARELAPRIESFVTEAIAARILWG